MCGRLWRYEHVGGCTVVKAPLPSPSFQSPGLSNVAIGLVATSEKGFMNVKVTCSGQPGHSSMPMPGDTSVTVMAKAVSALNEKPQPPHFDSTSPFRQVRESSAVGIRRVVIHLRPPQLAPCHLTPTNSASPQPTSLYPTPPHPIPLHSPPLHPTSSSVSFWRVRCPTCPYSPTVCYSVIYGCSDR